MFYLQVRNHPVKAQPSDQSGSVILAKEPVLQVNFNPLEVILFYRIIVIWHKGYFLVQTILNLYI